MMQVNQKHRGTYKYLKTFVNYSLCVRLLTFKAVYIVKLIYHPKYQLQPDRRMGETQYMNGNESILLS